MAVYGVYKQVLWCNAEIYIEIYTCGGILGAVDFTSKAISNRSYYFAMLHTLDGMLPVWCTCPLVVYNTVHKHVVVKRKSQEKITLFNSSPTYTHSITTSTHCYYIHYGWLTVIL